MRINNNIIGGSLLAIAMTVASCENEEWRTERTFTVDITEPHITFISRHDGDFYNTFCDINSNFFYYHHYYTEQYVNHCDALKSLTVIGPFGRDDFMCLRGHLYVFFDNLTTIDMSKAAISDVDIDRWDNFSRTYFSRMGSLTSVILPDNLSSIPNFCFEGCKNLNDVTIPSSVTKIGFKAFEYCTSLSDISIPSSVTEIGERAFYQCERLKNITIPNGVTKIGEYAFYGCHSFKNVTIPSSVTKIGEYAFYIWSELRNIRVEATTPPDIYQDTFNSDTYSSCTLHVPQSAVDRYKSNLYWSKFKNIVGY